MPDTKGSLFPSLLGNALVNTDRVHIIDTSDQVTQPAGPGGSNKTMLVSEFIAGFNALNTTGGALVKAGVSGGQIAVGGTLNNDDLILKPTAHGTPVPGSRVDIWGGSGANQTAAIRVDVAGIPSPPGTYGPAGDGHDRPQIIIGDNAAGNGNANQMMTIISGTPPSNAQRTLARGTGVLITGGDDYAGLGSTRAMLHCEFNNVAGSPDSFECHSGIFTTWGNNPGYGGNLSALTARVWDMSNRSTGSTFGGNFTTNIGVGSDFSGAPEPGITNRNTLVALEVDSNDHCMTEGTNVGCALRVTTNGTWDIMCGINLNSGATPGDFRNSILASTNPRTFTSPQGGLAAGYSSSHPYVVGEIAKVGNTHFMCKVANTGIAPTATVVQGIDPADTHWKLLQEANGPSDNLIWYGPTTANAPSGMPLFQVAARTGDITTSGFTELIGRADPGNPPAGHAYIYVRASDGALVCRTAANPAPFVLRA